MHREWRVEVVDDWVSDADGAQLRTADEPLGTKEKFWVRAPNGVRYLFKYARVRQGRTMGEDWVEWAVHELATLLSVPTATAIPAVHNGRRGVLSHSVLAADDRLIHGNELLARADPAYDSQAERENPGYTVQTVRVALEDIGAPIACRSPITTAFEAWAGYLMLDAWVAGRDRHHENWAVIEHVGQLNLSPSFDHGNALGFQEPESKLSELADNDDLLARWARRGRSHHFGGRPSLVHLAVAALDLVNDEVREYWLGKLADLDDHDITSVFAGISPEYLSEEGRTFRVKLLHLNREGILHGD
ncbi:hypothetical protein ABLE94_23180 [Gordonia sp. VNK1]|uniref:hypothetical protein n=1 Tax=Gordonia oleivorans TaxID=3156618 RepID=UPI0032B4E9AC